jgi:hypothetical protein
MMKTMIGMVLDSSVDVILILISMTMMTTVAAAAAE